MKKFLIIVLVIIGIATLSAQIPSNPTWIEADTIVCIGQEVEFIVSITDFETIVWKLPNGLIPISCSNEQQLTCYVDSTFSGGRVSVNGWNREFHHGKSVFKQVDIRGLPAGVPPITGDTLIEVGETYIYEIYPIIGMGPYIWEVPEFLQIIEGQSTMTVKVKVIGVGVGEMYVSAHNQCGNGPKSKLSIESLTGIQKLQFDGKIYPNPTTETLNLDLQTLPESIQIMDIHGRVLETTNTNFKKINVSYLPKGIYVLSLIYKDRIETTRFLKQ